MATLSACSALDRSEMLVVEVQRFRELPFASVLRGEGETRIFTI